MSYAIVPSLVLCRHYVSPEDKEKLSKTIPFSFDEIITGMMLGDGNMRMNGKHALLSVQQKNKEFVDYFWAICNGLNIIVNPVKKLIRLDKRSHKTTIAYGFQTLTLPYFTNLYKQWYQKIGKTTVKVIPIDINKTLTPLAIAYWVAGDGTFDKSRSRVILCTDNFTKEECELLQNIFTKKYNIETYLKFSSVKLKDQYKIVIPKRELVKFQTLVVDYLHPSMYYRVGL
jgi:hypothetical protein